MGADLGRVRRRGLVGRRCVTGVGFVVTLSHVCQSGVDSQLLSQPLLAAVLPTATLMGSHPLLTFWLVTFYFYFIFFFFFLLF